MPQSSAKKPSVLSLASSFLIRWRLRLGSALLLAGAAMPANAAQPPISILSPIAGESVTTASVSVSVRVRPALSEDPLQATLNGKDVSSLFLRGGNCRLGGCLYTATLFPQDGLLSGRNTLRVQVDSPRGHNHPWRTSFDWWPEGQPPMGSASSYLPAAVGIRTVTPGGGSPWIGIFSNQGAGSTTKYPETTSCTTTYQVLALNRRTLAFESYNCYDNDHDLTAALKLFTANDLVIAGSSWGANPQSKLDTTPIGGTNYGVANFPGNDFPQGYIVVGVGGAAAGQAYENASTDESGAYNVDTWARVNGLLTIDESGYYNFHPSDYSEFTVRPLSSSPSISVGPAKYTPPSGANGFWLLLLERRYLFSLPGCDPSPSDSNLYPDCGTFYATGSDDSATATKAMNDLATVLSGAGKSKLILLTSLGSHPFSSATQVPKSLADAVNALGGSGYTLTEMSNATAPAYTLISSNDTGFQKTLTGAAVISSSMDTGQTGFVHGVLGRDRNGLYRPLAASQETKDTIDTGNAADFSAYSIFWSQPAAWPKMDSPGRIGAYKYVSYQVVKANLIGAAGIHMDDLRFYYPGSQISTLLSGQTQPNRLSYPASAETAGWVDPVDSETYTFNQADFNDAAQQLATEFAYLTQAINFFDGPSNGGGVRAAILGDNTSVTANMFSAMATVQRSLAANEQAQAETNPSRMLKLAGTIVSVGSSLNPAFGVVGGLLNVASSVTAPPTYNSSSIPSAFADYETTVSGFINSSANYINNLQSGFDTVLDNAYSDWNKLSAIGRKVADTSPGGWYFVNQISLKPLGNETNYGSQRYFYLQLLPKAYNVDFWPAQPVSTPQQIGSVHTVCPAHGRCQEFCVKFYSTQHLPSLSWQSYPTPGNSTKKDVLVIGGPIGHDLFNNPTEQFPSQELVNTLFDPQGALKLPQDLFFAPNGPLSRRAGFTYTSTMCY